MRSPLRGLLFVRTCERSLRSCQRGWKRMKKAPPPIPYSRVNGWGGCLLVAAAQIDFFTPARLRLVNAYADLAILALQDDQFYENQAIQLRTMPASDVQQAHFTSFRRRVNEMINIPDPQVANIVQAAQLLWSQL